MTTALKPLVPDTARVGHPTRTTPEPAIAATSTPNQPNQLPLTEGGTADETASAQIRAERSESVPSESVPIGTPAVRTEAVGTEAAGTEAGWTEAGWTEGGGTEAPTIPVPVDQAGIDVLRTEIDEIDAELVRLILRRTAVSHAIGAARRGLGGPKIVYSREMAVLQRFRDLGPAGTDLGMLLLAMGRGKLGRK